MSLPFITVYAERDSLRLRYTLDWVLGERLGFQYNLIHDKAVAATSPHCLAYGFVENAASIHATSLLSEKDIKPHEINRSEWQGLHSLYFDATSPCDIQFDMLAGIFFLLTRYEEYFSFQRDRHGRYPATESLLHKDSVLERPVVDEWVEALRLFLQDVWNIHIPPNTFSYQPTYDIDIAWRYQFKGWRRTLGATGRDLVTGNFRQLNERYRVLSRLAPDPYNSFVWLAGQHMAYAIRPIWFFLAALQSSRFDKNVSPSHPKMASLISNFSQGAETGIHPSYYSDSKPGRLIEEKAALEAIVEKTVTLSRQHYIRLLFPATYKTLISQGITDDHSMGYSTHLGFRAGTGSSFLWYDLLEEKVTSLRVHPFAFMDTTAHYDLALTPSEAFRRLRAMAEKLQALHSTLITVMHNFSLGSDAAWKGWRGEYERFLRDVQMVT